MGPRLLTPNKFSSNIADGILLIFVDKNEDMSFTPMFIMDVFGVGSPSLGHYGGMH